MGRTKESILTSCMIVQQLDDNFFDWGFDELQSLDLARKGDISSVMQVIYNRLYDNGMTPSEMYGIIHNNDFRSNVWNDTLGEYTVVKKPDHFHIVVKFEKGSPSTIHNIAVAVGTIENAIEKAKAGRYSYDNMLSYLIHVKYADKTQYKPSQVFNIGGRSYQDIYNDRRSEWLQGRAKTVFKRARLDIEAIEEMILTGQVTKSQLLLTDEYFAVYSRFSRRCEDALRAYGERRAYKTAEALRNGEFKLSVLFVVGESGAGKTNVAKSIINDLIAESAKVGEPWRMCSTASSNPMDEYNGEEILFMDDVRGDAMTATDWLKLLDPYNSSPSSARYKNRQPACRAIIITSTKEPHEFFYFCKKAGGGDRSEAMDQFIRRIEYLVRVIRINDGVLNGNCLSISNVMHDKIGVNHRILIRDKTGFPADTANIYTHYNFSLLTNLGHSDGVNALVNGVMANNPTLFQSALPVPSTLNHDLTEYNTVFKPLWVSLNPGKDPNEIMTFNEWILYGKYNAYDYANHRYYRVQKN